VNTRQHRINQNFSFAEIDPKSLVDLKEIGRCELLIPETYFDQVHPGQYRHRIRDVRLIMTCATAPHTNISAKLTLLRSFIRIKATPDSAHLLEVPIAQGSSAVTSAAQGGAGIFELSFGNHLYMPFEGAGAISEWRLELPSDLQTNDYQSITDVVLNISYTAEEYSE
jgi:hypothetical protein